MATAALAQALPDRAPKSMAGPSARGGHDGQVLPARVAALASRCDRLVRLIADCQLHHERRAALTRELTRTRTKQIRAECRWLRKQERQTHEHV